MRFIISSSVFATRSFSRHHAISGNDHGYCSRPFTHLSHHQPFGWQQHYVVVSLLWHLMQLLLGHVEHYFMVVHNTGGGMAWCSHKTKPVPGSDERKLKKSQSVGADCVVFDLEDSVSLNKKSTARYMVYDALEVKTKNEIHWMLLTRDSHGRIQKCQVLKRQCVSMQ